MSPRISKIFVIQEHGLDSTVNSKLLDIVINLCLLQILRWIQVNFFILYIFYIIAFKDLIQGKASSKHL